MCKYCKAFKEHGVSVLVMKNGRPDEHGLTSLEMGRTDEYDADSDIHLIIREKPYQKKEYIWTKSKEPIHYCPYCGEKL